MIENFVVIPYIGVGTLNLGMNRSQLHQELGTPDREKKSRFGQRVIDYWSREDITILSSGPNGIVEEISFGAVQLNAEVKGIKFFDRSGPQVYRELCITDGAPRSDVGITVLFNLGITLDGFLIGDQEQRVVTVFKRGIWSESDEQLKPIEIK